MDNIHRSHAAAGWPDGPHGGPHGARNHARAHARTWHPQRNV